MTVSSAICISGCVYEFQQSVDLCVGVHTRTSEQPAPSAHSPTCAVGLALGWWWVCRKQHRWWSMKFEVMLRSHLCLTPSRRQLGRPSLGHLRGAGVGAVSQGDPDRTPHCTGCQLPSPASCSARP